MERKWIRSLSDLRDVLAAGTGKLERVRFPNPERSCTLMTGVFIARRTTDVRTARWSKIVRFRGGFPVVADVVPSKRTVARTAHTQTTSIVHALYDASHDSPRS